MGARFVIESMHIMWDAEKSNEDYKIEQKFESEWQDWRTPLGTHYDGAIACQLQSNHDNPIHNRITPHPRRPQQYVAP